VAAASPVAAVVVAVVVAGSTVWLGSFEVVYRLAPQMVVFSHGFGVERTARGMFSAIVANLPAGYGYALFDYYDFRDDEIEVTTFADQQARLLAVIDWVRQQTGVSTLSLVGHSMGCVIASLAKPAALDHVIFLAPPLQIGARTRRYFTAKPGARQDGDSWVVPRSDGSVSRFPEKLFDEIEAVDSAKALLAYAASQPLVVIAAGADQLLQAEDQSVLRSAAITRLVVAGADHNFSGPARQPLIDLVRQQLLS